MVVDTASASGRNAARNKKSLTLISCWSFRVGTVGGASWFIGAGYTTLSLGVGKTLLEAR